MSKHSGKQPLTLFDFIPETDAAGLCMPSCPVFVGGAPNRCKRGLGRIVKKKWVKPGPLCPRYPHSRPLMMMPKIKPNPVIWEPVKKGDKRSRMPDVNLGMIERFMGGIGANVVSTIITSQLENRVSALERLHVKALKRLKAGDRKFMGKFVKGAKR